MKKIGLIVFITTLFIGLVSALNCSVGNFEGLSSIKGSGNVKSETRDVSGFKAIEAGNAIVIQVAAGKDFAVKVEADDNLLPLIKTEVSGGELKIFTEGKISTRNEIRVRVSMPELDGISLSGASYGIVSGVNSNSLDLGASGASKITIEGRAQTIQAEASGASTIDAANLQTENANVEASGASNINVNTLNNLTAEASGASTIVYTGEPENIIEKSSGASSVKRK